VTRLLVIGTGPLLAEGVTFFSGQCLRTWHLAKPLLDAGHEVHLVTLPIDDRSHREGEAPLTGAEYQGLDHWRSGTNRLDLLMPELNRLARECLPEAILGINPGPSSVACRLDSHAPLWADMNGYAPAEGQTRGRVHDDDVALEHFWEMEWLVVRRADRISTVTRRQREATLGELAMAGRLSRHTFDHPFVHVIPNAVAEHFAAFRPPPPHLRGSRIPRDGFIILWSGGFNTWTDVDLLDEVLSRVMSQAPDVHFVATGGAIAGHDDRTFARFEEKSGRSEQAERRHLLGWVESQVVDAVFGEADLGINIDSPNWETHFGARNRLISMMACGLPVLTTRGTEISEDLDTAGVTLTAPMRDPISLTEKLLGAQEDPLALGELARRGREHVLQTYSCEATTRDLLAWVENPRPAPDQAHRRETSLETRLTRLDPDVFDPLLQAGADLEAIRSRWVWRLGKRLKSLIPRSRWR
jgi:glycosyltransferase involved in cell wall biosynthesis